MRGVGIMFDRIEVKCPSDLSEKTRKIKLWRMESVKSWMIFTKNDTIGALDHLKITCSFDKKIAN